MAATLSVTLRRERSILRWVGWLGWAAALLPLGYWLYCGITEPVFELRESVVIRTGRWALRLLLLTLLVAPLAHLLQRQWLRQFRRTLGLLTFCFATAHALFYTWSAYLWPHHLYLLLTRPYLLCGLVALLLLLPLALTSSDRMTRRLGPGRWRRIHYCVYPALLLVLAHELLYGHSTYREIGVHIALASVVLTLRLRHAVRRRLVPPSWQIF